MSRGHRSSPEPPATLIMKVTLRVDARRSRTNQIAGRGRGIYNGALFRDRQRDSRLIFSQSPDRRSAAVNKRTFLKLFVRGDGMAVVSPRLARASGGKLKNWAGNLEYSTENLYAAELAGAGTAIRQATENVEGTRHPPLLQQHCRQHAGPPLAPVDGQGRALDPQARTVTVDAGMSYGQLCPYLHEKGFALHNLASLPHISIAGACSTATHGSGEKNGNLATAVSPGNRDRDGRRDQALPSADADSSRSRGGAGCAGCHHQDYPGDSAYLHDAADFYENLPLVS